LEALTDLLSTYFGTLVETILEHGGDIVSFGGDAMIAVWEREDRIDAALRASLCGLVLQMRMSEVARDEKEKLELKVAIDQGRVEYIYCGGVLGRWETALTGDALTWISSPGLTLAPLAVTLSSRVATTLGTRALTTPQPDGSAHLKALTVRVDPLSADKLHIPPERSPIVRSFLQKSIRIRLEAGQGDWLAEMREITAIFISLADIGSNKEFEQTHQLIAAIQRALYRYEGSLYQFFADNKGATLIAANATLSQ
jgi:hypothetical protein